MDDELRQAYKLTISERSMREVVQERYSDLRAVDWAVERVDWTGSGSLVLWITEPARTAPEDEEPSPW
jgi:hypothetical protein